MEIPIIQTKGKFQNLGDRIPVVRQEKIATHVDHGRKPSNYQME